MFAAPARPAFYAFFFLPGFILARTFRAFSMSRAVHSRMLLPPTFSTGGASTVSAAICRCSVRIVTPSLPAASRVEKRFTMIEESIIIAVAYCVAYCDGERERKGEKERECRIRRTNEIQQNCSFRNRQVASSTLALGSTFSISYGTHGLQNGRNCGW